MKVSVVMAVCNGEKFLQPQLDSIASQLRTPDELIVSDDASSDNSLEIVKSFALSAPFPVRILQNTSQRGVDENFSLALGASSGDVVFLCDQDDIWLSEKIVTVTDFMEKNPEVSLVMNDAEIVGPNLESTGISRLDQIRSSGSGLDSFVMGCCVAVRQDFLSLFLPVPKGLGCDDWLVGASIGLGERAIIPQVLQLYRRHGGNVSSSLTSRVEPTSRVHVYLEAIKKLVSPKVRYIETQGQLEGIQLSSSAVRALLTSCAESDRDRISRLVSKFENERILLEWRMRVRQKSLAPRIVFASTGLIRGKYQSGRRLRSLFRDVWG